ncbi:MAG: UbiA family prenyltransferase [Desulfovibrionaceae bacterium]
MSKVTSEPTLALGRWKIYLALSRTPHGLLDIATPVLAMLLWLGGFPSFGTMILGLFTVFAGYTAVYAINDIVDYRVDQARFRTERKSEVEGPSPGYLDAIFIRHPLAQGKMTLAQAVLWAIFWGAAAFAGAWSLNPVCALLLTLGVVLEGIYCKLLTVSHLRALINGVVKTLGPLAAVFAVDPAPAAWFMALLFAWVFLWEIGGQNIPADWHDIEEDRDQGAKTIPVALGESKASGFSLGCLSGSVLTGALLFAVAPLNLPLPASLAALVLGAWLCVQPALALRRSKLRNDASALFNRASYYPAAMLLAALVGMVLRSV